ncbi:hypothetical protein CR513_18784, partial [Mucuna pruriens]
MGGLKIQENRQNLPYHHRIQVGEVKEVLKRMDNGKCIGEQGIIWFTGLFNEILISKKMSVEWRRSTLIPIFKNMRDN